MQGDILIPPSPNWFLLNAVDSRTEDGLMVTASFKSIVIYQMLKEGGLPKVLKVLPYINEKIHLVRLYPEASHPEYGKTIACCGDGPSLRLVSLETGDDIWQQREQLEATFTGLSWGRYGEEPAVVCVDVKGRMVVWQPTRGMTRVHKFSQINTLTCLEVNPKDRSQAVIGGEKSMLLVELKDGKVLMQFHGHNSDIYCIRWFIGDSSPFPGDLAENKNNEVQDNDIPKGSECDNWRSKPVSSNSTGPFIASSDHSRQVFLWDLSAKRYITKVTVPISSSSAQRKFQGKEKLPGKQHITLAWFKEELISSTPKGELLSWKLWPGGGRSTVLHHLHNRAIYNVELMGDVVITCGQDRAIHGYDISNSSHLFQYPTLGACASAFAFCPHDINRLALGSQENTIRFINFESEVPLQTQTSWQCIKGKILSISWHPEQEGRLLFGTASGQVGWVDMNSGRVTTFSYYHQKAVYKVEWAPPICPEKIQLKDTWCAYSFGDREIAIRSSSDPMSDPVQLLPLLSGNENTKSLKDVTEFGFNINHEYLAIGCNDGQVHLYRSSDLKLVVSLFVLRKSIQHLLWQPPTSSSYSDILAVGSNENKVCIFDLSSELQKETTDTQVLTQATRELCGHESRVVWLSWSPHQVDVLASASYDHTVQLWNTSTGEALVNYGGHVHRVFRVEFSPTDPDLLYSFAEENSVHMWKPSQLTCQTPSESLAKSKELRSKKVIEQGPLEEETREEAPAVSAEKKGTGTSKPSEKATASNMMVANNKKAAYKSFFPKLHAVCSRKKSFFHMVILNLLALGKEKQAENAAGADQLEDLGDELEDSSVSKELGDEEQLSVIDDTSKHHNFLLEKDAEMPPPEEIAYALKMYGKPLHMDTLLTSEISEHNKRGNDIQADVMHCWQGSVEEHIRTVARLKKLTPFLVASAPQVSVKLWEFASEAYAEQLIESGDVITGATYLVNINKVEDAVDILIKNRFYREALAIAKCRLGYNEELVKKITLAWAASAVYEGAFDFAATLQISLGQIEEAARTMARRNDHGSLFVSSQLYTNVGNKDLAKSIGLLSLKEACVKQQYDTIDKFLLHLPEFQWFQTISCCHGTLSKVLEQVTLNSLSPSYLLVKEQMDVGVENAVASETDKADVVEEHSGFEKMAIGLYLREEWSAKGFSDSQYPQLYETITSNFSTQQIPTSVKQLWFLVAVEVCELLLSPSVELWEHHLTTALNYALSWGKADQIYHLTHLLLPNGVSDLSKIASLCFELQEGSNKAVSFLFLLYHMSDLSVLKANLKEGGSWSSAVSEADNNDTGNLAETSIKAYLDDTPRDVILPDSKKESANVDGAVEMDVGKLVNELQKLEVGEDKKTPAEYATELLNRIDYHCEFFLRNTDEFCLLGKVSGSFSQPKELLSDISAVLKEKGYWKEEDIESLMSKVNSIKS